MGNLISTTLADGTTETRQYDASNRLTGITTQNASGTVLWGFLHKPSKRGIKSFTPQRRQISPGNGKH